MALKFEEGKHELKYGTVSFRSAAGADLDVLLLKAMEKPIRIVDAYIMFSELDTFASGVDIDIETDDGATETEVASYDTDAGTSVSEINHFTFAGGEPVIDVNEWFQLRVNDAEDVACSFSICFAYVELEALPEGVV